MRIAFLGLGKMGLPIAKLLLRSNPDLVIWNRTPGRTAELIAEGATLAESLEGAVKEADVVFTMLNDDQSMESVVFGGDASPGFLSAMRTGAIHVSLSTISVKLSQRLAAEHNRSQSEFVAAPVFGRPNVAAEGKLWIVVAGREESVARVRPLLESISRGLTIVSEEPWRAHALKIGGNFLITAMIESLSEALVFAGAQGIDPETFLESVNSALFRSPLYEAYGKVMLNPPDKPGATIGLGAKDMNLFRHAAQSAGVQTPLADRFAANLAKAAEAGLKERDWAAGLYELAKNSNTQTQK
ncbi:6-phosphogluconate dehydrogenase, NAD-binding [Acidisarcina polymorpha]|uniref:6-phosphogluconate dehydrogenase, NAD-binding n=1 Tax=Acidisarcina polymorpha TaxID=2211140 RepID=A0A2Z5FUE6_9BACT|nr:NAD(P)-dependent oxidoreductase [Acidisarcina polymorpha]AXC10499.1 6-phosphogluconate dehydrogenase, NAD-binding [Acidisarcina polymorpha]